VPVWQAETIPDSTLSNLKPPKGLPTHRQYHPTSEIPARLMHSTVAIEFRLPNMGLWSLGKGKTYTVPKPTLTNEAEKILANGWILHNNPLDYCYRVIAKTLELALQGKKTINN